MAGSDFRFWKHISLIPIRTQLLVLVIAVVVPLVAILAFTIYSSAQQNIAEAKSNAHLLAVVAASDVTRILAGNREVLKQMAKRPVIRAVDRKHCDPVLWDFLGLFPKSANMTVIDLNGIAICSAVPQPGGKPVNVGKAEWFKRSLAEDGFVVSKPFFGPITGRWVTVLTYPIHDDSGNKTGFLGLPLDLALYEPNLSGAPLIAGTTVVIQTEDGVIVWRNIDPEKWVGKNVSNFKTARQLQALRSGETEGVGLDGVSRFYAVTPVEGVEWSVVVGIPSDSVYSRVRAILIRNILMGTVSLLAVIGFALFVASRIEKPIKELAFVAQDVKKGNFRIRAGLEGAPEIVEVAEEFNAMLDVRLRAEEKLMELSEVLESRVKERTMQLEAANAELESFAYSVSHDLRTPLRAIDGFSHILQDEYGGKFDAEGQRLLKVVWDNAQRMGQLIDDILQFSRTGRLELEIAGIDMESMARSVLDELRLAIPADNLQVEIGHLPRAKGDRAMLHQVFANLLSNAIKFSRTNKAPVIKVGGSIKENEAVYFVADNGVGFDMQYVDKLFGVFQRLHSVNEFEGTGIGLAIVKRIVERHGGRVWAEGKVGSGSTFYFSLPQRAGESD